MQTLRSMDFNKRPGIAEAVDWSRALVGLGETDITPDLLLETAGVLLKYRDDITRLEAQGAERILTGEVDTARSSTQR